MANFFDHAVAAAQAQTRIVETLGVPFADPFNEEAVIADVNDPKKLGRVKVTTDDGLTSNWIPVSGSSRGLLSARYIGARVLVGKTNGRSENMYVIGITKVDPGVGIVGTPIQLPIIDESMAVWNDTSDRGMKCNEGNEGRMYILSGEMNEDVVVCLRRTGLQIEGKPSWAWKSMTQGIWIEKGINPGNETTIAIEQAQKRNPGIPECTESLLGERHDFSEDRGFRTTTMVCRRDEDGEFGWLPESTPPTFFRTTLPSCTSKNHGMEAVVDDGNNSEFVTCLRYQGLMRWVKNGKRLPHKFYPKDKPDRKKEFLAGFKSIEWMEESPVESDTGYDWVKAPEIRDAVLDTVISKIPLTGTDPELKRLLMISGMLPATAFNGAGALSAAAREAMNRKTGIPIDTLVNTLRQQLDRDGKLDMSTAPILTGTGDAGKVLIEGVISGTVEGALGNIGQNALRNSLLSLNPKTASVMTGLMSGGVWGAVDTAAVLGLNKLPPEVNKYVQPVLGIAKNVLSGYPTALGSILNTASGGGLTAAITSSLNSAIGRNVVTPGIISGLGGLLGSGGLGPVGQMFNGLSNLTGIPKAPAPLNSFPLLASTAMGALGIGGSVQSLFGAGGGLGFAGLAGLIGGGFNPVATILGGIGLFSSLFGSGGPNCPCDPKCRKVSHGVDSDGLSLLDPCGSLTGNGTNAYNPVGIPVPNNTGDVAKQLGLSHTGVGENLIPENIRDASLAITSIDRVGNMAEKYYESRYADEVEEKLENAYTFEAVEKAVKVIDNNITRVESVERKLIDSVYNILQNIFWSPEGAVLEKLITDVRENSQAIKDVYGFVKSLDLKKDGPRVGVNVTPSIALAFKNIPDLASLYKENREETEEIKDKGILPADEEWKSMEPGLGVESTIGEYLDTISDPFPNERTLFDEIRVISTSLESKISDDIQESADPIDNVLSPSQIDSLKNKFFDPRRGEYRSAEDFPRTTTRNFSLPPGTILPPGTVFPPGSSLPTGVPLPSGTVLPAGTVFPPGSTLPPGVTAIPEGGVASSLYEQVKARESGEISCE
jgi:hypothetical protein